MPKWLLMTLEEVLMERFLFKYFLTIKSKSLKTLIQKGGDSTPAAKVVQEIKANGGEAVPNYDSVEFGDRIIKTALDTYGRVDIVINNAYLIRFLDKF